MKLYSRDGQTMVDVKKLGREGDDLAMQCKLMNAYSMKIYLRPNELREALGLLNWEIISCLPEMLVKGTKGEEKLREIGRVLTKTAGADLKLVFGENSGEKLRAVGAAVGATTIQGLFEVLLLLLRVLLEDQDSGQ